MRRYVTIPEQPIQLVHPETGKPFQTQDPDTEKWTDDEPWTFWMYIRRQIISDPDRFGESYDGLVTVMQIKDAFEKAESGDEVEIDNDAWKIMCEAIDKPKNKWNMPLAGIALLPYMEAIKKAETKSAKKEKAKQLKSAKAEA